MQKHNRCRQQTKVKKCSVFPTEGSLGACAADHMASGLYVEVMGSGGVHCGFGYHYGPPPSTFRVDNLSLCFWDADCDFLGCFAEVFCKVTTR